MRIKDIAQMAGVSTAMVSRVINNKGYVSREKRERIEKIIEQTGFQINVHARSLRTNRSGLIASVIPSLDSSYILELQEKLIEALEQQGFHLLITTWRREGDPQDLPSIFSSLASTGVDGIILFHDGLSPEEKEFLQNFQIPLVVVDTVVDHVRCLLNAQEEAGASLAALAAENGFTSIAYLSAPTLKESAGIEKELAKHPEIRAVSIPFDLAKSHNQQIPQIARTLVEIQPPVQLFLSFSDRVAAGVKCFTKLQGLEILCAGCGNTSFHQLSGSLSVSVDLHSGDLITEIVSSLLRLISGEPFEELVWKNTCEISHPENLKLPGTG